MTVVWMFLLFVAGFFLGRELGLLQSQDTVDAAKRDAKFWCDVAAKQRAQIARMLPFGTPDRFNVTWNDDLAKDVID